MTRWAILCGVLLAVGSEASASGLQSALTTSLTGLQAAQTTISVVRNPLPGSPTRNFITLPSGRLLFEPELELQRREEKVFEEIERSLSDVEGSVFIDAAASTLDQGVFGDGPTVEYNPVTGGLRVEAPPLLGPADEFGQRFEYTPSTIRIEAGDNFAPTLSLPSIERLRRNNQSPLVITFSSGLPSPDDTRSFLPVDTSETDLTVSESFIEFSNRSSSLGSFAVSFDQLLLPGLEEADFAIDPALLTEDGIAVAPNDSLVQSFVQLQSILDPEGSAATFPGLPEISVEITYDLVGRPGIFLGRPLRSLSLLATPVAVPEPSTFVAILLALSIALLPRRFAPRVA